MSRTRIALFISCLFCIQVSAETLYVSDVLRITIRTGPAVENEIIEIIASGDVLETIGDEADGWLQVRTERGAEGFAMSRYLVSEPIARDQLANLQVQLESLQGEPESLQATVLQVQNENRILSAENKELSFEVQKMAESLSSISNLSTKSIAIATERDELREERDNLLLDLDEARIEKLVLLDQSDKKWAMVGAGVLFFGIVLGLILSSLQSRRRSSWSSPSF